MSGGGGDGGAKAMREQEEKRQARINAAVETINGVFNGKPRVEVSGRAGSFNPGQVYYTADGSQFAIPMRDVIGTKQLRGGYDSGLPGRTVKSVVGQEVDQDAINRAVQAGLYTNVKTIAPAPRESLYAEQKQAVTDLNTQDVTKQFTQAERNARFGLARSGLLGGSEDVNVRADLTERQNKGLMQAAALGDQAAAELKNQDERARQSLISMAQSGIDTGTAQSMAMKQLDAAAQAAKGDRQVATVGDLFGSMTQAYMNRKQLAGYNSGLQNYQNGGFGSMNVRTGDSGTIHGT